MLRSRHVWKIVIIYALFGSLWIIFSDQLLHRFFVAAGDIVNLSILKGLLFIVITSALLYALIARQHARINASLKAREETEKRFKFLVENSLDCLAVIDSAGNQKYVSHGAELLFGFSRVELEGKGISDIVHPEDLPSVNDAWQEVIEHHEKTVSIQYRHIHKNDGWVDCEAVARNFLHDPEIGGIIASVRDISQRKRTEEKLLRRNHFITTVLDNLPIGLAVNYVDEGTATYMNRKFEEIYGWPKEELQNIEEFFKKVYPEKTYREQLMARILEDIQSGETERMSWTDIRVTTKSGEEKIIEAKNIPIHEQGLMISTVQDITESKRLQNQFMQMQKLESVGRLAGGVAHDLNNLLTPILGYSEMLLEEIDSQDEQYEAVAQINDAGEKAKNLVRQLLAFSRKQVLKFEAFNLNDTIVSFEKLIRRTIPEDIEITTIFDQDALFVKGDVGQIEQALMNLAVNAADSMPDGGELIIETSMVEFDDTHGSNRQGVKPGSYALLAVSDTGSGMDEATVKKIFEPFFSTKGDRGTGLGLATVYGIVKQHGGNILVYSETGGGSTFKIYLPLALEHIEEKMTIEPQIDIRGDESVLIVEDDQQVRRLASTMLKRQGYSILEADSGEEAIAISASYGGPIHLLLTDVVMPGMNGRELYREISKERPGMKTLFMSGYTDNVIAHRGVLDKDVHFVQKPFDSQTLATKVKEVLET